MILIDETNYKHIGEVVRDSLVSTISYKELSRQTGLHYNTIIRLINGSKPLTVKVALAIEPYLRKFIKADDLLIQQVSIDLKKERWIKEGLDSEY